MNKLTTPGEAVKKVRDGDTILVGGFLMAGSPETLIKALLESSAAKDLAIVSNDTGSQIQYDKGDEAGPRLKVIASYIRAIPTGQMLIDDPDSVTLYPPGHLAENPLRRSQHCCLLYASSASARSLKTAGKRTFDGKEYLLETAIAKRRLCKSDGSG